MAALTPLLNPHLVGRHFLFKPWKRDNKTLPTWLSEPKSDQVHVCGTNVFGAMTMKYLKCQKWKCQRSLVSKRKTITQDWRKQTN